MSLLSGAMQMFGASGANKAKVAQMKANARIARIQGLEQERAIRFQADMQTEVGRGHISSLRNTFSNRGIDITSGSPLLAANKMFSDQLSDRNEKFRQGEIAKIKGENQASQLESGAADLKSSLPTTLLGIGVSTAASMASNYAQGGGSFSFLKGERTATGSYGGGFSVPDYSNPHNMSPIR